MKKVLVLGSTGLLGSAVGKFFDNDPDYVCVLTNRNKDLAYGGHNLFFDAEDPEALDRISYDFDYVINCIGTIKPFMDSNPRAARYLNGIFPWDLAEWCNKIDAKLIHITTDCVYSGNLASGSYVESDDHDALDAYGKSKSLGEPVNDCMVLRTSIIGEEIHKNASLIEWAKSQKGKAVKGFTNHLWNGVTTKQYAKICDQIIKEDLWEQGLFHIHSRDVVTKNDMLSYFNEKFDLDLKITPLSTPDQCNRSLGSDKGLVKKLNIPTVKEQIESL